MALVFLWKFLLFHCWWICNVWAWISHTRKLWLLYASARGHMRANGGCGEGVCLGSYTQTQVEDWGRAWSHADVSFGYGMAAHLSMTHSDRNKVVDWVALYSIMFRHSIACPMPSAWITIASLLSCWQQRAYNYCSCEQPKHQQRFVQQLLRRWRCAGYQTEEDHHVEGLEKAWVFPTLFCMSVLFHKRSRSRWSRKGFSIKCNKVSK